MVVEDIKAYGYDESKTDACLDNDYVNNTLKHIWYLNWGYYSYWRN